LCDTTRQPGSVMDGHLYGWRDTHPTGAHEYLAPPVQQIIRRAAGKPPRRIVDAGCGNGYFAAGLAELGYEVAAFDASPDGIELAKRAHPAVGFYVASLYDKELATVVGRADAVVSLEVIEHLYYPRELFRRAREILTPGGLLVLSTPYHGYWKNLALAVTNQWDRHLHVDWDGGHIKFFSPATIRRMAEEQGFRDIRVSGAGRLPWLWKSMIVTARSP
jgi:2-polyprenyl-3-methyl-5-hydroxy-6-metoxy-1,4-benzoquinol methylase